MESILAPRGEKKKRERKEDDEAKIVELVSERPAKHTKTRRLPKAVDEVVVLERATMRM